MKARNIALFALPLLALACDALVGNQFSVSDAVCSSDSDCSAVKPAANMKTASCEESTCRIGQCKAGFEDCNGDAADGCESELATDDANCGSCGNACGAMGQCQSGKCLKWNCPAEFYDEEMAGPTDKACDCGCGVADPDCADATLMSCNSCDDSGSCSMNACDMMPTIDPANNAVCK